MQHVYPPTIGWLVTYFHHRLVFQVIFITHLHYQMKSIQEMLLSVLSHQLILQHFHFHNRQIHCCLNLQYQVIATKENSGSWCTDPDFLDFPEWADKIITGNDGLDPNWNELLVDNVTNLEPKMAYQVEKPCIAIPAQHQHLPSPSVESHSVVNPSSSAHNAPAKSRMRWTPELHEAFV